jgi:caspase domain-containing protein
MKRIVQVVVLLFLFAPAVASAASLPLRRIAVVVGANGAPAGRKPLRFAYNDAARVAEVLRLAGFAAKDIHLLRDPQPAALLSSLDDALHALSGASGETMLVFYYSGHADAQSLYPDGKQVSLLKLRERLDSAGTTVRVGIIDACRGGGWTGTKGLSEAEVFDVNLPLRLSNEGSVLISSSSGLEDAHESENLQGSFFTHHWNAALRGAGDHDGDGTITLAEAFEYAKERTVRDTAMQTDSPQHPSFQLNLRGKNDLPLVTMTTKGSLVTVEQVVGPLQLVHLDSGLVVLEVPPGKRRIRLAVPPGRYLARRSTATETFASEITVVAGKATQLREEDLTLVGSPSLAVKGFTQARRMMLTFGIGNGVISGTDSEDASQGISWTLSIGFRVRPHLHVLFNGDYTTSARYQPDPDLSQQQSALTLGVRWAPLEFPTPERTLCINLTNFYLKAGLGVGHIIRQPYGSLNPLETEQGRWGGAATGGIGWGVLSGAKVGFSVEATDSLVLYSDEARHNFSVNGVFSVQLL